MATSSPSPEATTEPSPSVAPTPTYDGIDMVLIVEARCYLEITADGQAQPRSGQVIEAGETIEVQADEQVTVRYGNAGGVIVEINGQTYGRPGGNGEVVEITYGPDGPVETPDA